MEVKVSIENGKSRIFLLNNEQPSLAELRSKIKEKNWEAVGKNFYFLKDGSEINQTDENQYKLSSFKKDDKIEVIISPQQSDADQTRSKDQRLAVKEAQEKSEKALEDQNTLKAHLNSNEKPKLGGIAPDTSLITDKTNSKTENGGSYYLQGWKQLEPLLDSFRFPKALKVTSEGLSLVNRPGVKLRNPITNSDIHNDFDSNDYAQTCLSEWEKQTYKMLAKDVKASIGIPIPQLSATLGVSARYQETSESVTQVKETRLFMVSQRVIKKVKVVLKEDNIEITEEFKQRIEGANELIELRQVFEKYGYFVPTTYLIGGKIVAEKTETFSGTLDRKALASKFQAGVSLDLDKAGFKASASGGYSREEQDQSSEISSITASQISMTLKGGDEALRNDGTQWISSLTLDRWQVIGYEDLVPVINFLDAALKKKCEKILSTRIPINKLPSKVAEELKSLVLDASWSTVNTRSGNQGDVRKHDISFQKHSLNMSDAIAAEELKLSQKVLEDIKGGIWSAAWHTANTRAGIEDDAKNDLKEFNRRFESLKNSKEVTDQLAENIKNMCIAGAWHIANKRKGYKEDEQRDLEEFDMYYSRIVG
jgi:hypothetical protein